jgi:hypothetical protein
LGGAAHLLWQIAPYEAVPKIGNCAERSQRLRAVPYKGGEGNMLLFGFNGRATRNFLILLVSMHYILFIDRVNLAAAAPVIQQDLGLSNLALGLAFSAFNYAYAPFQLVGGWFADRFGARRTLTVCGLVWSLTTIATGAVTGLASLFGVRLVLGMGEGATLPAATRAVSKWTPIEKRGTAIGAGLVAPSAGARIETPRHRRADRARPVAPSAGARIETSVRSHPV